MPNTVPAAPHARPTSTHCATSGHEKAGTATRGITSPMPVMRAIPNAANDASSSVGTWRATARSKRASSSTNIVEPSGAKKSAPKHAAMPVAAA